MEKRMEELGSDVWVEEAFHHDSMPATLLMAMSKDRRPLHRWARRLPRTKHQQQKALLEATASPKELKESARASPTTPLSWCGDSSFSSFDDAARPLADPKWPGEISQSHDPPSAAQPSTADTGSKLDEKKTTSRMKIGAKRKKTSAELKQEEMSLLTDCKNLTREIETQRAIYMELLVKNENLRKLELELEMKSAAKQWSNISDSDPVEARKRVIKTSDMSTPVKEITDSDPSLGLKNSSNCSLAPQVNIYLLPDLNLPCGENYN